GLPPVTPVRAAEALDHRVAAAEQGFVLSIERPLLVANALEALDLVERPLEPAVKAADDSLQVVDEAVDVPSQLGIRRDHFVLSGPTLPEHPTHFGQQVGSVRGDDRPERRQIEGLLPETAVLEQVRAD